ncbi:MAG: hypothetical protein DWG76_02580 [Chloroflexi bacterium]|nr:hypothetical protein [Chloroflexota bacterium]
MKKMFLVLGLAAIALAGCVVDARVEGGGEDAGVLGASAYVDKAELVVMESYPAKVSVHVVGSTPTPCHEFRYQYEMQIFGKTNRVDIMVYSEGDPAALPAQVLEPFDETIPIGLENAPEGTYEVFVNGELVGEFNFPG